MRYLTLSNVEPGARLAQPVFGPAGLPLLHAGVALTPDYLTMLAERGLPAVYVEDPDTSDLPPTDPLSAQTRARVTANLARAFEDVTERTEDLRGAYVAVARREMAASRFADAIKSAIGSAGFNTMSADVEAMLTELKGRQVLTGLNSIKSHDSYTFQHSIDVTIMGMVLARAANWESWRLRAFGVGCMLHDLGKLFIAPALLNKPGKLSEDEFTQLRAHPAVGYEAIKAVGDQFGALAPHVAYQHHERQDGRGYPRGLRGTNTLGANEPGMIHDFASIAAVADVYDAMTSDRPYRRGWVPARTLAMIRDGAGMHFNRQAVDILSATVPPFPVCSEVVVLDGRYAGWRGMVTEVLRANLARPTVRLMHDAQGVRVDAVELNLRKEADVRIDAAPSAGSPTSAAAA